MSWKPLLVTAIIAIVAVECFNRWIRPRIFNA